MVPKHLDLAIRGEGTPVGHFQGHTLVVVEDRNSRHRTSPYNRCFPTPNGRADPASPGPGPDGRGDERATGKSHAEPQGAGCDSPGPWMIRYLERSRRDGRILGLDKRVVAIPELLGLLRFTHMGTGTHVLFLPLSETPPSRRDRRSRRCQILVCSSCATSCSPSRRGLYDRLRGWRPLFTSPGHHSNCLGADAVAGKRRKEMLYRARHMAYDF